MLFLVISLKNLDTSSFYFFFSLNFEALFNIFRRISKLYLLLTFKCSFLCKSLLQFSISSEINLTAKFPARAHSRNLSAESRASNFVEFWGLFDMFPKISIFYSLLTFKCSFLCGVNCSFLFVRKINLTPKLPARAHSRNLSGAIKSGESLR